MMVKDLELGTNMKSLMLKPLEEQVIVITGAASGIGLATARMAAERGAKVVAVDWNEEAINELAAELRADGKTAMAVAADVGREEDVNRVAEQVIAELGRFDTWVNNAGVSIFGHAMDVSTEDMHRMFDTVYWGVVYGSRAAVRHFQKRGEPGALINVGSLFGDRGPVLQSTYSSAKFAVHGWTENIRMELEKESVPVSVTLVHPGRIDTPYNEHAQSYMEKQPAHIGMIYPPEAVAEAILLAAEKPKRDIYVGAQAKALRVIGRAFPRFTDHLMKVWLYPTQHDDRPSHSQDTPGLHEPGYGMEERGTNTGWKRGGSWYVQAKKHPVVTTALITGASALALNAWKRKR